MGVMEGEGVGVKMFRFNYDLKQFRLYRFFMFIDKFNDLPLASLATSVKAFDRV